MRGRQSTVLAVAVLVVFATALVGSVAGANGGDEPTTVLVSRAGKGGNGNSLEPSISGDGRYVAFVSRATNLSPAAKSGKREVFVRDMQTGKVTLASRANGVNGAPASYARSPSISADGRYVAFASSGELGGDGTDGQVYVRDLQTDTTVLASRANGPGGRRGTTSRANRLSPPTACTSLSNPTPTTWSPTTRRPPARATSSSATSPPASPS